MENFVNYFLVIVNVIGDVILFCFRIMVIIKFIMKWWLEYEIFMLFVGNIGS